MKDSNYDDVVTKTSKNILHLLQLQQAGKRRPECFSPKNMNGCDTPL